MGVVSNSLFDRVLLSILFYVRPAARPAVALAAKPAAACAPPGLCSTRAPPPPRGPRSDLGEMAGDSKSTVRGYCSEIPRFEESLNN